MKRELTANENLLIIEALKALMQDKRAEATINRKEKEFNNFRRVSALNDKYLEAQTLRNALLNKGAKLYIETT